MRIALDTNILVYAENINGPEPRDAALALIAGLTAETVLVPMQVLGELFHVLVRKGARSPEEARAAFLRWRSTFETISTNEDAFLAAADLSVDHKIMIWDAVILSAAADARCGLFLSEDLQDGFVWRGLTVANPFAPKRHPLIDAALGTGRI